MIDLIFRPLETSETAEDASIIKILLYLFLIGLFTGATTYFMFSGLLGEFLVSGIIAAILYAWIGIPLGALFFWYMMNMLEADNAPYKSAFTCVVYAASAPTLFAFIASLFALIPIAGAGIAAAVVYVGLIFGLGVFFRTSLELFDARPITTLVVVILLKLSAFMAVYFGFFSLFNSLI